MEHLLNLECEDEPLGQVEHEEEDSHLPAGLGILHVPWHCLKWQISSSLVRKWRETVECYVTFAKGNFTDGIDIDVCCQQYQLKFSFNWAYPSLFLFIFKHKFYRKNCMLQRDSNSDRWSRSRARWPLDHHHGPIFLYFLSWLQWMSPPRSGKMMYFK